jgi:hypothetical protein
MSSIAGTIQFHYIPQHYPLQAVQNENSIGAIVHNHVSVLLWVTDKHIYLRVQQNNFRNKNRKQQNYKWHLWRRNWNSYFDTSLKNNNYADSTMRREWLAHGHEKGIRIKMDRKEIYGTLRKRCFNKVPEDTKQTWQEIEKERSWEDERLETFCFMHINRNNANKKKQKHFTGIYHLSSSEHDKWNRICKESHSSFSCLSQFDICR